jgi:acetyl-CoA carboxylase biotin carboxyl carrier protein
MEFKEIQELIKLVSKSNISGLKIKQGDFEIKISNKGDEVYTNGVPVAVQQVPVYQPQVLAQPVAQAATADAAVAPKAESAKQDAAAANSFTFKSPMIGTFYRKPSPDKEVFVKVGDVVKNGDVLCVIEAMKLFNEIEFDGGEGRIVKILADDSSPVEYDQPLFLIEKIG